ncbi:hypothetical protein D3C73_953310 [compost metagenome]
MRNALRLLRCQFFKQGTDAAHHVDVLLFVVPADVVGLADLAGGHHCEQCPGVIFDEQPVAHLQAVAIHRQRLAGQGVEDNQRNQFLGKVERPVIVRTIGQQHRQAIGSLPGADQVVGRGLAGGVGRAGCVGRRFRKQVIDAVQVTVNLVGGNVMKAEGAFLRLREGLPIGTGGFEQAVGADDVGLDEL